MSLEKSRDNRPSPSRFLSLPRELRDQIYRELLLEDVAWDEPQDRYNLQPAILRVNKLVNEEASCILYDENCWVLFKIACNKDYDHILKKNYCRSVSSSSVEVFPQQTFLKVEVRGLWFVRKPVKYFLTTVEGLLWTCKNFTCPFSFHPLDIKLYFNLSGKRRETLLDSALDAFQEARGIEHAAVFGTEPVSKGNDLAGLMMTRVQSLDELAIRAKVYETRGRQMLEANNIREASHEYIVGRRYAEWAGHYLANILEDEFLDFLGKGGWSPYTQASDFEYATILCLIKSGRTAEAIMTLDGHEHTTSEKSKKHFLRSIAFMCDGIRVEAIYEFIWALRWSLPAEATKDKIDALEAHLEEDPNPQMSIIFYYRSIQEIFQHQSIIMAGKKSFAHIGGINYLTVFVSHAWHELREIEAVSVS